MENPLDQVVDDTGARPDIVRKGIGIGAGMLGALVARQVIHRFRRGKGRPGVIEGMLWTALVGAAAQLGRVAAKRAVAATWARRQAKEVAPTAVSP